MKKLSDKQQAHNLRKSDQAMERLSGKKTKHHQTDTNPYNSKIIEQLMGIVSGGYEVRKATVKVKVPNTFSLIDNPRESLATICKLARTVRGSRQTKIKRCAIDHSDMSDIDLAAETILDQVVTEINREHKSRRRKLQFSGQYPASIRLQRLIRGIGIIKSLGIEHEYLPRSQANKIEVFVRSAKDQKPDAGSLSYVEQTAKNFVDHVNKCLKKIQRELTDAAVDLLSTYTGEIIGNANEHSGQKSWFVVGYYDHHDESHLCEIAIFNFGKTFAQTFSELPEDSFAFRAITPYITKHNGWNQEDLLTLVALQGDISSKNMTKDDTRGNGTVEMIEFFDKISKEVSDSGSAPDVSAPEMVIISGSTHIRFDGKYRLGDDDRGRKIIAFNAENDLEYPPDSKYVTNLGTLNFPGTVICIKFPLPENQVFETEI